jgi:hypothetical protein
LAVLKIRCHLGKFINFTHLPITYCDSCECCFHADMKVTKQISSIGHVLQGKRKNI